jgi:predicted short-subunit dehydrogenase-like oxidoreductase (DUF2520 family)
MSAERSAAQPHPAPRLAVGVIGVGRVGGPLAAALARAGHPLVGAHAVSERSRRQVQAFLPGAPLLSAAEVMAAADLVLLTVPDDVLPELVSGLADTAAVTPGQFLVHASGRFGTAVLEPATRLGALPMALHPVMTFTGRRSDLDRLSGCPFGVTAPPVLRPVAEALVVEMGGDPMWVPEEARPLYHAALANGANHLVTLVAQTLDLLAIVGVENPAGLVRPLLTAALDNVLAMGDDALTGPVARGDAGTVAAHLDALSRAAPEARAAYVAMARLTADRALAAGRLDPATAESLLDVLG